MPPGDPAPPIREPTTKRKKQLIVNDTLNKGFILHPGGLLRGKWDVFHHTPMSPILLP